MLYKMRIHKGDGYWSFEWLTTSSLYSISIEQEKRKNKDPVGNASRALFRFGT